MKQLALLMIAFMLMPGFAAAEQSETRMETIMLEGVAEEIETTRFESNRGYSIWLDTSRFELLPEDEGGGVDQYVPIDGGYGSPVMLTIHGWNPIDYTIDDAQRDTMSMLTDNGFQAEEMELAKDFLEAYEIRGISGIMDDQFMLYYLIGTQSGIYYASIECPMEAAEGFATRLIYAVASFEAFPLDEGSEG